MLDELQALIGEECSAVCFVRDYVELHFDGPVLRCISDPRGRWGEWAWQFPDDNAPVAMRLYIGQTVTDVEFVPGDRVVLAFGPHKWLIPLDEDSRVGPEAIHLVPSRPDGSPDLARMRIE